MISSLGGYGLRNALCGNTTLENQSKARRPVSGKLLCRVSLLSSRENRVKYCKERLQLSNNFFGRRLTPATIKVFGPEVVMTPRAVLTAEPASEVISKKVNLDGHSELQVTVSTPSPDLPPQINIQITNPSGSPVLHWGAVCSQQNGWLLPSHRSSGTQVYNNEALRTPFVISGPNSSLQIEIDEPDVQAIEFLVHDEARNKWFKDNGRNFNIVLPPKGTSNPVRSARNQSASVPKDLVQVQAYLRWERNGRQNYTPAKEKEEYEVARYELLQEINQGVSVDELRARLAKSSDNAPGTANAESGKLETSVTNDLHGQLGKSLSLDETRKTTANDAVHTEVPKQSENKSYFSAEELQQKQRDIMRLINKCPSETVQQKGPSPPKAPTTLELFSNAKVGQDGCRVLNKKFKLHDKELLVLVSSSNEKTKVCMATDHDGPVVLHWGLSRKAGEWMKPPSSTMPFDSVMLEKSCETPFRRSSSGDPFSQIREVEIEIDGGDFSGMPFVLREDANWIKNNGSDFYVDFKPKGDKVRKDVGDGKNTAKSLLDRIAELESEAQRSFMHRFNIAADLMGEAIDSGKLGLAGILVWMRFMATRQLVWNKNYNVKPREISKAQDRLTDSLQKAYESSPQYRELLRMIMSTVGRGGEGDVGQRIRDEILVIQRNNDCKGSMMEEWHQKLHNNTSPDDVVICQALTDYIKSDFDINVYWGTLNSNGITKERLLSYDRAIHSEPDFRSEQKEGLLRDLGHYMRTLKAVHSGADLEFSIATCMGYEAEGQGFMVGVQINPIRGLPSGFPELLRFVLEHVEDREVEHLLKGLLEARKELQPILQKPHERLKDLIFLDIALDSMVRTAMERGYEELRGASSEKIMYFITLVLENLAMSSGDNEDLIYCLKGWYNAIDMSKFGDDQWALFAKSCLDRTRLGLSSKADQYEKIVQPSAEYLGSLLEIDRWALDIFTEEIIRAGSAASLSTLLNHLDPTLRRVANLGSWQVISPNEVTGYIVNVDELITVQHKSYEKPTILVAKCVKGEEEVPDGTVAILTPDMPDVLSHVSVRARNCKICFATCFDAEIFTDLQENEGKLIHLRPTPSDIIYSDAKESDLSNSSSDSLGDDQSLPSISLAKKQFLGKYVISAAEFTPDMVGAKSRNIAHLKGKLPSWIGVPTSVALPFGVFEKVMSNESNQAVAHELELLKAKLDDGEHEVLAEIRRTVLQLDAPSQLVVELKEKMQESGMPWPGDESDGRWQQAWLAIKKVWASKWNDRAFFSTRKVKLDHNYLSMAVLVQEIVSADYAFVIHTTNPSTGDSSEIYAEVVRGLGETLVGAHPGRALSFVCKKSDLTSPIVLGYPSKPIGLFIRQSIIFRSDSNGEDLEGYAGAGLYDSVPMDKEDEVILDYSSDPLVVDVNFRKSMLSKIAEVGNAVEELYGSAQDIEGVVKDGKITVVQTRPQM